MKSLLMTCILLVGLFAKADVSAEDMNKSNNPLTPMLGLSLQDYDTSSIYGTNDTSNTGLVRGVLPHLLFGTPQIARLTIPYVSAPSSDGQVHGFGDMNLFDIFLLPAVDGMAFGVGPYFVFPTASKDELGAGKWQLGASAAAIIPAGWGILGGLLTYQHDVAGDSDRPTQNIATAQPFFIWNLPSAFYFRSTGIWNFDWGTGHYYIPIGAGLGKIWETTDHSTINFFIEPQWTVAHDGVGQPNYQTFIGLNLQFPIGGSKAATHQQSIFDSVAGMRRN